MADSGTVVAVNTDPAARIFDHADLGAVADAVNVVQRICERHPIG
jgi:electron transfer flavoprotein alpha subunit